MSVSMPKWLKETDVLPEGTKFYFPEKEVSLQCGRKFIRAPIFVIEQKPTIRTLAFHRPGSHCHTVAHANGRIEHLTRAKPIGRLALPRHGSPFPNQGVVYFRLSLPYCVFLPYYDGLALFFRNAPLTSLSDALHQACVLPNVEFDNNGAICLGDVIDHQKAMLRGGELANVMVDAFWNSCFTTFLSYSQQSPDERVETYESWARHTELDPFFTLKVKWPVATILWQEIVNLTGYS